MPAIEACPPTPAGTPLALTFILPTRNRREQVGRAVASCLQAHAGGVRVEVLVVDGNSTDGSFEELQQRHGNDSRVRLLRQQGAKGFMAACFFAIPQVRTPFATFMYDDDVLSPFWADLPRELQRRRAGFVMGFSVEADVTKTHHFEQITKLLVVKPATLLRAYCGGGHQLSAHSLPFSPICCLTQTEWLRSWAKEMEVFTRGRPLREYFMMQRNAGPDLMIYFHSILNHPGEIVVFHGPVAQFSTHRGSMTAGFEQTDLVVGYWLAQVWLCNRLLALSCWLEAGWCAAYTVRGGLRLALKRVRRSRWQWLGSLLKEVAALAGLALVSRAAGPFVKSFMIFLLPRGWRPKSGLLLRTEQLAG